MSGAPPSVSKLQHPFRLGSLTAIVYGVIALTLGIWSRPGPQPLIEEDVLAILVLGYLPITFAVLPLFTGIWMRARLGNTDGFGAYYLGLAVFGAVFSYILYGWFYFAVT